MGRRLMNGSNISNSPSPTVSPSEFFPSSSKSSILNDTPQTPEPPPIPPRCSLIKTNNTHSTSQLSDSNKTEYNYSRSRNFRRKESTNSRSDSVDSSSKQYHRQFSNEQGANSD